MCNLYTSRTHFSIWIQLWCLFWCQTNHFREFLCFIYMYICYTPFFSVNSAITVIISSGDYILIIYDMVITSHHFLFCIQWWLSLCNIWYHQTSFLNGNSAVKFMPVWAEFELHYNKLLIKKIIIIWTIYNMGGYNNKNKGIIGNWYWWWGWVKNTM